MKKVSVLSSMALMLAAWCTGASAASAEAKVAYAGAMDGAAAGYAQDRARCDAITGNPKDVCVAQAKAGRVRAEADAKAHYKNTLRAYTQARVLIAEATFDVDTVRCASLTGNPKQVCVRQAKSAKVAALADAKADKKVIEARSNARQDKRIAEYKVATEKCDALAGSAKDQCVAAAKTQFGY